ncbi:MAG: hypothetical protein A3D65_06920 [Candidatus Lloydbacteria bacterium RIFCSPHIGHO2_02_FULL_50_13]|uniref:Uncharacterized protein n=1 Tax=Candidatus Lloydbacteria bacterium RIFCSPHIGHO2_02_FULL_50_13 TaxID=1798661 RepID=A0A1G2D7I0_9BACT|nr:MAG: hypothetical protein A3D65_06920 [Candidatus Lloydbacteria bacterium RIFCSPHIGHO2_02_FULL_50_13]
MAEQKMSVVDGQSPEESKRELVEHWRKLIRRLGLSQKTATRLNRDVWLEVESARPFREDPEVYIAARLEEQIKCYEELGLDKAAGFRVGNFRAALEPLIVKTVAYFAPPTQHPIMDGEFCVFLVIPPEWVSIHWQIMNVRSPSGQIPNGACVEGFQEALAKLPEVTEFGKPTPRVPYVLVGINGGRGLKDLSLGQANSEVKKNGYTYFSLHQLAQLLMVRPNWLGANSETIAFGERYGKDHLGFSGQHYSGPQATILRVPHESSCVGVGKPYYTKIITTQ